MLSCSKRGAGLASVGRNHRLDEFIGNIRISWRQWNGHCYAAGHRGVPERCFLYPCEEVCAADIDINFFQLHDIGNRTSEDLKQ